MNSVCRMKSNVLNEFFSVDIRSACLVLHKDWKRNIE